MLFILVLLYSMPKATEAHINFSKQNSQRTLTAAISVNALKLLGNPKEVVFNKHLKKIREASIDDRKVTLSGTGNTFSVTGNDAEELLGYWNVELNDKGELELFRDVA
jgi:aminopeptidase N